MKFYLPLFSSPTWHPSSVISHLLTICIFLLLGANALRAQTEIKGQVIDEGTGEALYGATVVIKGTTNGAATDFDGLFSIQTSQKLPITLVVTYVGYSTKEIEVTNTTQKLVISVGENAALIETVEVKGQRISEKQKAAPLTVESLDVLAIKQTASSNFYDGLGALKGVDLTTASLGFTIINTRGFNSTSPVRSLQIIDGVDNQAPGLNFSLGNFLGSSELDVLKVDLVVGASSAFYGPNAFNGVISMETKNPFFQKGLTFMLKIGERNLTERAIRWADAIKNKNGKDFIAYKFNFSYLRAYDWVADNFDPVFDTKSGKDNPGRYDAVNIYGDEYFPLNDASTVAPWDKYAGLKIFHRTGYKEEDLVDYNTQNMKANAALHFRLRPNDDYNSPELILSSSFGSGTTVYQGDNRFSLRNILFYQNRIELRKRDTYFIRAYATNEDAGDSYDPYFTALRLQEAAKSNENWSKDYRKFWSFNNINDKMKNLGYPSLIFDPNTGMFSFDQATANQWLIDYQDSLAVWHQQAEAYSNLKSSTPGVPSETFFDADSLGHKSQRFLDEFKRITSAKSNKKENGTRFYDKSALYHVHGEYKFTPSWVNSITVGANYRLYRPVSDGTIFQDSNDIKIKNSEFGVYTGFEKKFLKNKFSASATVRLDKNENFKMLATPAASLVYNPDSKNYLRISFSSAIRNPTLTDQYLNLNVGRATLVGNLSGFDSLITTQSFKEYVDSFKFDKIRYFNIAPIQPEKVKTFEIGYRTTLFNSVYLDAGYYYSFYDDFIGYNIGLDADFQQGLVNDLTVYRVAANSKNQVTTQGFSIGLNYYFKNYYMLAGNYSWNKLNKSFPDDPIIPAFNTPENKFNISLSGRDIPIKIGKLELNKTGFNINYKWIQGFIFEGSPQFTGQIPAYGLLDAQINYTSDDDRVTLKIGASNLLDNYHFETYGGPRIGRMAYLTLLFDFSKK